MKKTIAMIIVLVMAAISASGCGGSGTDAPAQSGRTYADEIPSTDYVDNVFKPLINMEIGAAGSSLKAAQTAEEILSFAADRQISDTEETARKAAFSEAWNSLSNEEKEVAKHNFYEEEIADLIDSAFDDYESVRGRFEDAGVGAEMEELSKNADARKSWNTLRELMSDVEL